MMPGNLRHPVRLEKLVLVSDGYGGQEEAWIDQGRVWASIDGLRGQELVAAQQIHPETTLRVEIRYRDDLNSTEWRITQGEKRLDIKSVLPDNRQARLVLTCSEGVL